MSPVINSVIRIVDSSVGGLYRIVAYPRDSGVLFLFRLASASDTEPTSSQNATQYKQPRVIRLSLKECNALDELGLINSITIDAGRKLHLAYEELSQAEQKLFRSRERVAFYFLDHEKVADALMSKRGIGGLSSEIRKLHKISRSSVDRIWILLCTYGFTITSLNPRLDRCGAPGVARPCNNNRQKAGRKTNKEKLGIPEPNPQTGVTEAMRNLIIAADKAIGVDSRGKFQGRHDRIVETCFVKEWEQTPEGMKPIFPSKGTIPNLRQIRRVVDCAVEKLERKRRGTTQGHFDRNHRGLSGKAWQDIPGPGHSYAIDATFGDIFLRSDTERAWPIGRPIVYIAVDVWSTAIVGFHVCLHFPCWDMAKLAVFSTMADPNFTAELWGYTPGRTLCPRPSVPCLYLADRGEFLCAAAQDTLKGLGTNSKFNTSYRPDLKGIVEVLHRITKDHQFQFIPGAIDARRRELELRRCSRDSAFTVREYVKYLSVVFEKYNFSTDRRHRLDVDMMVAGVDPTPAGLWKYGYEMGIGFSKEHSTSKLITSLFPTKDAVIRKDGVHLDGLPYCSSIVDQFNWAANARNFGVDTEKMYYFPGNNSRIWWPNPNEPKLEAFDLKDWSPAPRGTSFLEWEDIRKYDKLKDNQREYERHAASFNLTHDTQAMVASAQEKTDKADEDYQRPVPGIKEARELEKTPALLPINEPPHVALPDQNGDARHVAYESLMEGLIDIDDSEREDA